MLQMLAGFALPALLGDDAKKIFSIETILKYVNLGFQILERGIGSVNEIRALNDRIATQVASGREPSDEEWQIEFSLIRDAQARISAEADRRRNDSGE